MVKHHRGEFPVGPGTLVWFYPAPNSGLQQSHGDGPLAALVASVISENSVNLSVLDPSGSWFNQGPVLYLHRGESTMGNAWCIEPGKEAKVTESEPDPEPVEPESGVG